MCVSVCVCLWCWPGDFLVSDRPELHTPSVLPHEQNLVTGQAI